jgi:hypothetical protein
MIAGRRAGQRIGNDLAQGIQVDRKVDPRHGVPEAIGVPSAQARHSIADLFG